jgi:hypothetical protein
MTSESGWIAAHRRHMEPEKPTLLVKFPAIWSTSLPSVEMMAPGAFASTESEANQPHDGKNERRNPQDVDCKPSA